MNTELTENFSRRSSFTVAKFSPALARASVASVWIYHGLYSKLLGASPRHLLIVQSVPGLGGQVGTIALTIIGAAEVLLGLWLVLNVFPWACALTQTIALLTMNVLELSFARQHLLSPAGLIPLNLIFLGLAWYGAEAKLPLYLLRRHPIPMQAKFDECLVLTYALPARVLTPLLPPGLTLDTVREYGFVAAAFVQTRDMKPAHWPLRGSDFFLAGYRIFVKFKTPTGRTLRGLRILRSDADRWRMVIGGNLLTHYTYRKCVASLKANSNSLEVVVKDELGTTQVSAFPALEEALPESSPFESTHEARRFAGPLPYTFDYERETNSIIAIRGVRTNWRPRLVQVDVAEMSFFDQPIFHGVKPILAAAFHVRDIGYRWERGVRYSLEERKS